MGKYDNLPPPLLPLEVDLRGFDYFELHVEQLMHSQLATLSIRRPRLLASGLALWCMAWHEVPAGSVPDDDDMLSRGALCPPAEWARSKNDILRSEIDRDGKMRGWVLCRDGRWWHTVVVERVIKAWSGRVAFLYHRAAGKVKKASQRSGKSNWSISEFMTLEQWTYLNYPQTYTVLYGENVPGDMAPRPEGQGVLSLGTASGQGGGVPMFSRKEGEGEVEGDTYACEVSPGTNQPGPDFAVEYAAFIEVYKPPRTHSPLESSLAFRKAVDRGNSPAVLIACAKLYVAERGDQVQNPKRFLEETWRNYEPEAKRRFDVEAALKSDLEAAKQTWGQYADTIIAEIGEGKFRAWFRKTRLVANGGSFYVITPSSLVFDRLSEEFEPVLRKVLPMPFEIKLEPETPND